MRKFNAFTLAEVLITLGIIGVVAAMTMPTLMNQTNGAQYKAAYKKALSALSQAITLNVALDGGSFADTVEGTAGATTKPASGDSVASILASRMNIVKASGKDTYAFTDSNTVAEEKAITDADTFLYFNDGMLFAFKNDTAKECTNVSTDSKKNVFCEGFIDVNGLKGPNKVVTCDSGKYTAGTAAKSAEGKEDDPDYKPAVAGTEASCASVTSPTDVYPVYFYDQTVLPKSAAAKAVLYGK